MDTLPRKWARRAIVCIVIGVLIMFYAAKVDEMVYGLIALMYMTAGIFIKQKYLRCPMCGQGGGAVPQWKQDGKYHCRRCGTPLKYDDEQ